MDLECTLRCRALDAHPMEYAAALTPVTMAFDPPMVRRTQRGHARDVPMPSFQPGALRRYAANRDVVPLTSDNPSGRMG